VNLIAANEGLSNCTLALTDWPGMRLAAPPGETLATVIVRYGEPENSPVAFAKVTPAVSP